jgi:hypothetical protein
MKRYTHRLTSLFTVAPFALVALLVPSAARAEVACRSEAPIVKAVTTDQDYLQIKKLFQFEAPFLEPLLETTISVGGTGLSCVLATFSTVLTPVDNYVVFQVTLDGMPMLGHTRLYIHPEIPVVVETEETDLNLPRLVSHQFFLRVSPGVHTVTVKAAWGSGFDPAAYPGLEQPYYPTVTAPVLSLQYR